MTNKKLAATRLTEMVETHNIVKSLARLDGAPHDCDRWKRAFYHALLIHRGHDKDTIKLIREALKLP